MKISLQTFFVAAFTDWISTKHKKHWVPLPHGASITSNMCEMYLFPLPKLSLCWKQLTVILSYVVFSKKLGLLGNSSFSFFFFFDFFVHSWHVFRQLEVEGNRRRRVMGTRDHRSDSNQRHCGCMACSSACWAATLFDVCMPFIACLSVVEEGSPLCFPWGLKVYPF